MRFQKILVKIPVVSQVGVALFFLLVGGAAVIVLKHTIFQSKVLHFLRVILQGRRLAIILGSTTATVPFVALVACRENESGQLGGASSFNFIHKRAFLSTPYISFSKAAAGFTGLTGRRAF